MDELYEMAWFDFLLLTNVRRTPRLGTRFSLNALAKFLITKFQSDILCTYFQENMPNNLFHLRPQKITKKILHKQTFTADHKV